MLKSILAQVIGYITALTAAILVGHCFNDLPPFQLVIIGDVVATVVIFIFSMAVKNSSMYDPYWSLCPAVIAGYYLFIDLPGVDSMRAALVFALALIYSIRLTYNFARSWPGLSHQDWRYDMLRKVSGDRLWPLMSFGAIHLFPSIMTWLGSISLYPAMASAANRPFNGLDIVAAIVTFSSVLIAYIADQQMYNFRTNPENKGKVMTDGLWYYSRHPNYIGETLFWFGLYLFALAADPSWWYWALTGPLAMFLMFRFASIPMMEKRSIERRPQYTLETKGIPLYFPPSFEKRFEKP